jgi:hypothetical protein
MSSNAQSSETHARAMLAKEFIISEIVKQAQLDNIPLSEIERKMLYFTEGEGAPPDILETNHRFEEQYDMPAYEKKIAMLIHNACERGQNESPESKKRWRQATSDLSKEDHYVLVMVGQAKSAVRPPHDTFKLLLSALALAVLGTAGGFLALKYKIEDYFPWIVAAVGVAGALLWHWRPGRPR